MALPLTRQQSLWPADEPASLQAWRVRASTRARRLSLRVHQDGSVEVIRPARCSERVMRQFVERHGEWIRRQQQRLQPFIRHDDFPPASLALPAVGEILPWAAPTGSTPARSRARAVRWLCEYAHAKFEPLLRQLATRMEVDFERLQLRSQRSRWGSCSARGTISLNCALLFQPPAVLRYLMIHELAHRRHMNHSARFWALVAQHEPGWRELDRQLRQGWRAVPSWLLQRESPA
ncbi:MAG TPA: SprT family zinc-dependent metalloprotease [Steroidobacteraceae bacterium]|nr:SprT family zinc-dependent metalloprotease [Steroidobacteraceae bacterium]